MKKVIIVCISSLIASCSHNPFSAKHLQKELCQKIFKMQDSNNDEVITKKELTTHHKSQFKNVDTNRNGKLTRAEAKITGIEEEFNRHGNKTKKGHLTFKETLKIEEERFDKADTDHDGKVTKEEFTMHCKEASFCKAKKNK